jgi:hypothetical protein
MIRSKLFLFLLCLSLFCIIGSRSASAQSNAPANLSAASHGSSNSQFLSNEITFVGTIQKPAAKAVHGSPRELHLMVAGPQGVFDANVGPYLTADVKQSLSAGQQVQVAGVVQTFHGKDYLLVRELTVAGRILTIRNEHGFLVRPQASSATRAQHRANSRNGGAQ